MTNIKQQNGTIGKHKIVSKRKTLISQLIFILVQEHYCEQDSQYHEIKCVSKPQVTVPTLALFRNLPRYSLRKTCMLEGLCLTEIPLRRTRHHW